MNEDEAMQTIYKKIEREKALINAANAMRAQTNNEAVRSKLDTQMRDGRRNLEFFEGKLRELQMRKMGHDMSGMSLGPGSPGSRASVGAPPGQGGQPGQWGPGGGASRMGPDGGPAPPPKDAGAGAGQQGYGQMGYGGGPGDMMPPRHPYANPGPGQAMPKARPNFTKLGLLSPPSVLAARAFMC